MLPRLVLSVLVAVSPLAPLHVVHPFEAVGRYDAGDRGVDLAGVPGQAVVSATAGTVTFAGAVGGLGVVSVDLGDGRRLTYEPVAPSVHTGQQLGAGAPLGVLTVGRAGCPAPACLHWGLVSGRGATVTYADPLPLLGHARVRLLPLPGRPSPEPSSAAPSTDLPAPHARDVGAARMLTRASAAVGTPSARSPVIAAVSVTGVGLGTLMVGGRYVRRRGRASRRAHSP